MSPTVTTFLFEVANFLTLAGLLAWLLFRPVRDALEKRKQAIANEQQQAAGKLADAERLRADIEQRLADFNMELQTERDASRREATLESERIVASAHAASERERASLKRQLTYLEHGRAERLAQIVAETAGQVVGRLLRQIAGEDLDAALIRVAGRELQAIAGNSIAPVVVESARELTAAEQNALTQAAGTPEPPVEFRISRELHAGLRITTNRGLIDFSDAGLAEYAERELSTRLTREIQANGSSVPHA